MSAFSNALTSAVLVLDALPFLESRARRPVLGLQALRGEPLLFRPHL